MSFAIKSKSKTTCSRFSVYFNFFFRRKLIKRAQKLLLKCINVLTFLVNRVENFLLNVQFFLCRVLRNN